MMLASVVFLCVTRALAWQSLPTSLNPVRREVVVQQSPFSGRVPPLFSSTAEKDETEATAEEEEAPQPPEEEDDPREALKEQIADLEKRKKFMSVS